MDYKNAGVDIEAGYKSVELMKDAVKSTFRPEVLGGIGGFSGAFSLEKIKQMEDPVPLSGTDGCGTKVKLAFIMDKPGTPPPLPSCPLKLITAAIVIAPNIIAVNLDSFTRNKSTNLFIIPPVIAILHVPLFLSYIQFNKTLNLLKVASVPALKPCWTKLS